MNEHERDAEGRESVRGLYVSDVKISFLVGGRPQFLGFARVVLNGALVLDHLSVCQNSRGTYFVTFPVQPKTDSRDFFYYYRGCAQGFVEMISAAVEAKIKSNSGDLSNPFSMRGHALQRAEKIARTGTLPSSTTEPQSDPGARQL